MSRFGLGETVGEAFIRIRASGAGLSDDIRRAFDKEEPTIRGAGQRSASSYRKGFLDELEKEMGSPTTGKKFNESLQKAMARSDITKDFFEGQDWKTFKQRMATDFGDAGRVAAANLQRSLAQGGDFKAFEARLANINREVARATAQIQADEKRAVADAAKARNASLAAVQARIRELNSLHREGSAVFREFERAAAARKTLFAKTDTGFAAKQFENIMKDVERIRDGFRNTSFSTSEATAHIAAMRARLAEVREQTARVESGTAAVDRRMKDGLRDVSDFERKMSNLIKDIERLDIGRAFGKGARNDFFNIMGRIIGSVLEFTATIGIKATRAVVKFFSVLNQTQGLTNKLLFVLDGLVGGFFKLASAAGLAFLGLGAILELIAGPLVAAVADLAGVITALAATIGIGLVGAVSALLPLLGVMGAGLGVIVLAFVKMDKAQKAALKQTLKPVIADWHELHKVASQSLFSDLGKQVPLLHTLMQKSVIPIVRAAGDAMADSMTHFLQVLTGPVAQKNLSVLTRLIPTAGRALGRIFSSLFNIIGGFLRAATPITREFLRALTNSAGSAAKLINSAKGQNTLKKWLDGAWDSAKKLYTTAKLLVEILFTILDAAKPTGDTFFDTINKDLQHFEDFLRSPRGQRALQSWMEQTKQFVRALGFAVHGITVLFDALNNQKSQGFLNALLKGLGLLAQGMAQVIPPFDQFIKIVTPTVVGILKGFFGVLKALFEFLDKHKTTATIVAGSLTVLWLALKTIKIGSSILGGLTTLKNFATGLFSAAVNIGRGMAAVVFAMRTGTGQALTAGERLNAAIGGIGLAVAANVAGSQVGGAGGKAISIGGGALGLGLTGAAIGSLFPGPGTAVGFGIGAVIGGVTSAIASFWEDSTKAAQAAKQAQIDAMQAIQDEAKQLVVSLQQDQDKIGKFTKESIASSLTVPSKGQAQSPLLEARLAGVRETLLVSAASGNAQAQKDVRSILSASLFNIDQQLTKQQNNLKQAKLALADINLAGSNATPGEKKLAQQRVDAAQAQLDALQAQAGAIQDVNQRVFGEAAATKLAIQTDDLWKAAVHQLDLSHRDLATQIEAYRKVLRGSSLDAERNREFIRDHVKAMEEDAAANAKTKGAADKAALGLINQTDAFRKQLIAAGFNRKEVNKLVRQYGEIPKSIVTKLETNTTAADAKIAGMLFKKGLIQKPALFKILSEVPPDTRDKILTTLAQKGLITKQWLIRLVGKDEASRIIAHVKGGLDSLPKDTPLTITVTAQTAGRLASTLRSQLGTAFGKASGGIITGPQVHLVGEAGAEAIVPLNRPLSQVDQSVRWLSAFAQGLESRSASKGGGVTNNRIVNVQPGAIIVSTPTTDPMAVAAETLNRMVARGGYG